MRRKQKPRRAWTPGFPTPQVLICCFVDWRLQVTRSAEACSAAAFPVEAKPSTARLYRTALPPISCEPEGFEQERLC